MSSVFNFIGGTKAADFILANHPVDYIGGPIGSGKTKAMCLRVGRHAQEQRPSPKDGVRYTRFAMVRNTMPDLKRSTIRTWLETYPEDTYGRFTYGATMGHKLRYPFEGGPVHCEVDFISLDKTDDVKKLRSTEYTGVCFNELPFIEKELFDEADSRLRYPPQEHGGPTWRGVLGDGNAPDEDHWLATMAYGLDPPVGLAEADRALYEWPDSWGLYMQPAALIEEFDARGQITGYHINPEAENLKNLPADYYDRQLRGKTKAWIDSRLMNRVALVAEGQPVWPMFRREFHVSREALRPIPGYGVLVWLDFGRVYPAALFAQVIGGRIYVIYEILGFNEPASVFAPKVQRFLTTNFPGYTARFTGDPKGRDKGQQTEQSSYDIFAAHGMPVIPCPVKMNDIETRTEAVAFAFNDNPAGINRLVISPACRSLVVGCAGRYCLVREETGVLKPKKDKWSNLCDCLQYGVISCGDGRRMIGLSPIGLVMPAKLGRMRRTMRRIAG